MAQKIRVSLLQVSAVCIVGSLIRSAVLPKTIKRTVSLTTVPRLTYAGTYGYRDRKC